jgi:hypothetical protein
MTTEWPDLPYAALAPTAQTLQLMTQIVGKVRLARTPWINHSWHVTLYVSARGLTTGLIPGDGAGVEMEFDFIAHELAVRASGGGERRVPLAPGSVAAFHAQVADALTALGAPTAIFAAPNEMAEATPFAADQAPRPYDPAMANAFWRALIAIHCVFTRFRSRFLGKVSPVHFFWGGCDLAVTRFSGRRAPRHPGGIAHLPDAVTREAYSHEVSSVGFWPGGPGMEAPAFYAYAWPAPAGFAEAAVLPREAGWNAALGEFVLPYAAVRAAREPEAALMAFLQSTYEAAADLAGWDRAALECAEGEVGRPRPVN